MASLREAQRHLDVEVEAFRVIQKDLSKSHQLRQQFTLQLNENEMVHKELDVLDDDANVYKLIGPVLVKQDLVEARSNVGKRIEYIGNELKRLDAALKSLDNKQEAKKEEVLKAQQRVQALQAKAAPK